MLYVVMLEHEDGHISYVGKDPYDEYKEPTAVFTLTSAKGKVRWWKKISRQFGTHTNLTAIYIKPATIQVGGSVTETIIP